MEFLRKKSFLYVVVGLLFSGIVLGAAFSTSRGGLLSASILAILNNVAIQHAPALPDLAIENIALKKVADPSSNFNFYKYKATIIVHNYGGNIVNARATVHGDDKQKYAVVANNEKGFTLLRDKTFIINDYDVLFDGDYNGGEINFEVELVDKVDSNTENNSKAVEVFEAPAKIDGIDVRKVNPDGYIELGFLADKFAPDLHKFEIIRSDEAIFEEGEKRYAEKDSKDSPFEYFRIRNSREHVAKFFEGEEFDGQSPVYVTAEKPYLYLKATDPFSGSYAVSNIINFTKPVAMTKAEFIKLFIEQAGLTIIDGGIEYFDDVDSSQWYAPYIQTFYNLGLLPTASPILGPDNLISRPDVLKIVMDYFDEDLVGGRSNNFIDVNDEVLNVYLDSLVASNKASSFGEKFYPSNVATRNFLNYLINEYSQNN